MFWTLWTLSFNSLYASSDFSEDKKRSYYIAFFSLGVPGFLANILFSSLWHLMRKPSTECKGEETMSASLMHPLIEFEEDNKSGTRQYIRVGQVIVGQIITEGPDRDVACDYNKSNEQSSLTNQSLTEQFLSTLEATDDEIPPTLSPEKEPIHYINNLKIFLTFVVIIHHSFTTFEGRWPGIVSMGTNTNPTCWGMIIGRIFTITNDSYFMNLFFFYSGYFVPKSIDTKRRHDFLFDRVKRLGIPFTVYVYVLGPYVELGLASLLFNTPFPKMMQNAGTTWFNNQLMIYSVVYALACGPDWTTKVKCPSLLGFLMIGTTIGLFSGILMLFFPATDFFFTVPKFWQDFPSYPLYFFGGVIAQRNAWMEKIKDMHRGTVWKGLVSVTTCLALSVFFMDYGNKNIIQYVVIQFGLKVMLIVFESTGSIVYDGDQSSPNIYDRKMKFINDNLIFPAWLLTASVALGIIWPLSHCLKAIPGFSQVL
eukprot:scaffold48051_cov43-Cyclotella_meneghiniana.AAC.4